MDRTVDPMLGRTIGGVAIERKLGAGGMAAVYAGRDDEAGGAARAIKVLSVASPESHQVRFDREARIGRMLDHPLVVRVHRHGTCGDFRYMVMDLIDGEDLARVLRRTGPMHWPVVTTLGRDLAQALAHAHERGIVHRDVKAANIMVEPHGRARVLDFGLAKAFDQCALPECGTLTTAGEILGSPLVMSPEQCLGEPCDARTDVYATGVLLYQMLAGATPFRGGEAHRLLLLHLTEPPPPLRDVAFGVPAALDAAVLRALEKDPADRWPTALALRDALEAAARAWAGIVKIGRTHL
ncbi:MAG: serine/threonine protein kinase, partial [Planctomycetota bacterium]|nr:serine/threonine protein kinase [Planctomycetota bacterium]